METTFHSSVGRYIAMAGVYEIMHRIMRLTFLLLFTAISSQAAVWLTNGIDPNHIAFFGDLTGDGISDVAYGYECYINLQNNINPKFQRYRATQGYLPYLPYLQNIEVHRDKDNQFLVLQCYPKAAPYVSQWLSDCIFTCTVYCSISIFSENGYGNDIDADGFIDAAVSESDIAKVRFGSGDSTSYPYATAFSIAHTVRDENDFLISTIDKGRLLLLDIDQDMLCEVIMNSSPSATVYEIVTPTNWVAAGTCKTIQCFGDWDNDGIEDFMHTDGEVIFGVPEPFISLFLTIATVVFRRLRRETPALCGGFA